MLKEHNYLNEKHLQEDEYEPDINDIVKSIEWAEKLAEDLQPFEAEESHEWGMCYHEELR